MVMLLFFSHLFIGCCCGMQSLFYGLILKDYRLFKIWCKTKKGKLTKHQSETFKVIFHRAFLYQNYLLRTFRVMHWLSTQMSATSGYAVSINHEIRFYSKRFSWFIILNLVDVHAMVRISRKNHINKNLKEWLACLLVCFGFFIPIKNFYSDEQVTMTG